MCGCCESVLRIGVVCIVNRRTANVCCVLVSAFPTAARKPLVFVAQAAGVLIV